MLTRRACHLVQRTYTQYVVSSPYGEVTVPDVSIDQHVWENIHKWENKTAIECGLTGMRLTYKELRRKSKSLASSLTSLRMSGRTAMVVLPNCLEYPVALLGSMEAGLTVTPANPMYTSGELKHQAMDAGAEVVITDSGCLDRVLSTKLNLPIICTGDQLTGGIHSFKQISENWNEKTSLPKPLEKLTQLPLLPYSSGTTGLPKGVRLSHRNIISNQVQLSHKDLSPFLETTAEHQDTVPAVLPFFHSYGSLVVLLRSLSLGVKLVSLPKFEPEPFLNILRSNKNIVLYAVPPIVCFLGARPEVKPADLDGLRFTLTGAAPCGESDLQRLQEKKPHTIFQGYGMTEASPVLTHPPKSCQNLATVGPPLTGTMGKIIDCQNGDTLPPGKHGELCFKGPQVMEGYHNKPEATAETIDSEGWLHTGDIGYTDSQGNFYIVDRLKELIKVKGFQVAPAELEALLRKHPSILDVGITSVPSKKSGELPVAFLVPRPGEKIDEKKVLKWVADQVAPYKRLAKIIQVSEIPKSQAGKILRRKLKDIVKDQVQFD